jgi:ankyrin repeat protein
VKLLVEHGVDINAVNKKGKTALMFAVESRQIRLINYLLEAGADINVADANGLTALRMAKENYSEDIVTLLRQYNKK